MELSRISGFLPDTVRKTSHALAQLMKQRVELMAEEAGGKLIDFEIVARGEALLTISTEKARLAIVADFGRMDGVNVTTVSALEHDLAKNRKVQERANRLRAIRANKNQ